MSTRQTSLLGLVAVTVLLLSLGVAACGPTPAPTPLPTDTPLPTGTLRPTYTPTVLAAATKEPTPTTKPKPTKAEPTAKPTETPTRAKSPTPEPSSTPPKETPTPAATRAAGPVPKLSGSLLFPVFDPEDQTYHIFWLDLATGGMQKFIEEASQPAITPDGERIGWRSWKQDQRGLLSRPLDGVDIWRMIQFSEAGRPDWSPSGETFVFPSRQMPDRQSRLYLFTGIDESEPFIEIQRHGSPILGRTPVFLPDERIVYQGCVENVCGLYIMNVDGTNPQQLTEIKDDTTPAVSPDGRTIAYMTYAKPYWQIRTIDVDGSNPQLLTDDWYWNGLPTWSPDGQYIIFVSTRDENWPDTFSLVENEKSKFRLWIMDADGGNQRPLYDFEFRMDGVPAGAPEHETGGWIEERMIWLP